MSVVLEAKVRDTKKSTVNRLRNEGFLPAILYGNEVVNQAIFVNQSDFLKAYREIGKNGVLSLQLDQKSHPVMVHDLQIDPLKDEILHADFYKVNMNEEVDAQVPVQLIGEAIGAKEGGVVQQIMHELTVRALPAKLPSSISVAIDELHIGESIQVKDLPSSSDYQVINEPDETIVSVTARSAEVVETSDDQQQEQDLEKTEDDADEKDEE